jgi:hypothetical protein
MTQFDLRPMTLGEILDRTFSIYKSRFWLFAGIVSLPYLVTMLVGVFELGMMTATVTSASRGGSMSPSALGLIFTGFFGGAILLLVINLFVYSAAQSATVIAVSQLYLDRPATIYDSYRRIRGRLFTVVLVVVIMMMLVSAGFFLLIVPGIILLCRTIIAIPIATLEQVSASEAVSRSMRLSKGRAWHVFAVLVLVFVLMMVASTIFQLPFLLMAGSLFKPHALPIALFILSELFSWVASVLVAPVGTIALALLYYDLRIRKEAFDIEHLLARIEPGPAPVAGSAA